MSESTSQDVRTRLVRRILAAVVLLEGVLCVGYAVFLGVETVVALAADRLASVVMVAFALAVGGGLILAARAARRGRRAVRSPIVVWQLMQLSVAYLTWGTAWVALGIALTVLAVVAVVTALWPGVLEEDAPPM